MKIRKVNLTDTLDQFVRSRVESGRFENASEVVRAALRSLERDEREYEVKLATLQGMIDEVTPAELPKGTSSNGCVRSISVPGRRGKRIFRLFRRL